MRKSSIVFRGTVTRAGATEGFAATPTSVVVRVDRLFADVRGDRYVSDAEAHAMESSDAVVGSLQGKEVTLVAHDAPPVPGFVGYFFTTSTRWGASVEVAEDARRARSESPEYEELIPRARKAILDQAMYDRMSRADAVIVGAVDRIDPTPPSSFISHHDPAWTPAHVRPTKSLRGRVAEMATVKFSPSRDVCCVGFPKLVDGQAGVFVLHRDEREGDGSTYVLGPGDVLPVTDEKRLSELLACPPGLPITS